MSLNKNNLWQNSCSILLLEIHNTNVHIKSSGKFCSEEHFGTQSVPNNRFLHFMLHLNLCCTNNYCGSPRRGNREGKYIAPGHRAIKPHWDRMPSYLNLTLCCCSGYQCLVWSKHSIWDGPQGCYILGRETQKEQRKASHTIPFPLVLFPRIKR